MNYKCAFLAIPTAWRILVSQPEIEPMPLAVEAQSPSHWITGKFPKCVFFWGCAKHQRFYRYLKGMTSQYHVDRERGKEIKGGVYTSQGKEGAATFLWKPQVPHWNRCCFAALWTLANQATLVYGILQARILEWVAIPFSRWSFQSRVWKLVCISCIGNQILYHWAFWAAS